MFLFPASKKVAVLAHHCGSEETRKLFQRLIKVASQKPEGRAEEGTRMGQDSGVLIGHSIC